MSFCPSIHTVVSFFGFGILISVSEQGKPLDFKFQQDDYNVKFERVELVNFTKTYVNQFKITTFKYNRTCPAVNGTFQYKVEVGNDLEIVTQAYIFLSNEYRYNPIRMQFNFCDAIKFNYFGITEVTKCGNFSGCPIRKGIISSFCNWTLDPKQMPPLVPNGKYMLEMQGLYHNIELFVYRGYGEVYRPIAYN